MIYRPLNPFLFVLKLETFYAWEIIEMEKKKKINLKKLIIISAVILLLIVIVSAVVVFYYYSQSKKALATIANQNTEKTTYGIYVLKNSDYETAESLAEKKVAVAKDNLYSDVIKAIDEYSYEIVDYDDYFSLIDSLYNEEVQGIVLNTAYISLLEENELEEAFEEKTRLVTTIDIEKVVEAPEEIETVSPFIVYISGKDTWGHISVTSRSDVNIIAVVNPETKHILLVSTPRDYYVPLGIADGAMDKLTHAGVYGTEVSEDTLESLYDIEIDRYFKLNFSGFEGLINAMGGITVWSDYDFDVENIGHFSKGENQLNGLQALAFVRERHSFATGDVQRGDNQMNVIQSVVQKMCSKSTLLNYSDILKECDGTFATDLSTDEIAELVSFQISNPGDWNIEKMSVSGSGAHEYVYSLKNKAYVMIPNEDDIENAKQKIQEVLNEN